MIFHHFYDCAAQIVLRVQVTRDGQPRVQCRGHVKRPEKSEPGGPGEVELVVAEGHLLYQTSRRPYHRVRSHSPGDGVGDRKLHYAGKNGRHFWILGTRCLCSAKNGTLIESFAVLLLYIFRHWRLLPILQNWAILNKP